MFWILVGILLVTIFYYFGLKPLTYWKDKGVKQPEILTAFLENWLTIFKAISIVEFIKQRYQRYGAELRYYGTYTFNQPSFILKDVDLIKQMVIKDFEHFNEHRPFANEEADPMWAKNLFSLRGNQWRNMRSTLSPSFTSSKMKVMFVLIRENAQKFVDFYLNQDKDLMEIEIKDAASRYCTDVIASTAFGLEVDSLSNPNNEFFIRGKELTNSQGVKIMMKFIISIFFPKLMKVFNINLLTTEVRDFFTNLIEDTIKMREDKKVVRPDMIQLLLEAKKGDAPIQEHNPVSDTGYATTEEYLKSDITKPITNEDIAAQALVFFFAGYDSSSSLMSFLAYELCINQDIQDRLREEIKQTLEDCNDKLTFENLNNMKYMDMVVTEALRKWPVMSPIERVCTKPYLIPPTLPHEKEVYLNVGDVIELPVFGIHHDPELFPDPEVFDPERFGDENKLNVKQGSFQPFGLGPRNCIGSRYALLETKILFFYILNHFKIVTTDKTVIPVQLPKSVFTLIPTEGINMGLKRI